MRMRFLPLLLIAATPAVACPPLPEISIEQRELMRQVREAPDPETGRFLSSKVWEYWATAPDAYAQELLNTGLERRGTYDLDGAHSAFEALVEYCPHYAEGYNQRAFVNFMRGEFASALIDIDRVLEMRPDHFGALAGRALTLMSMGDVEAGQEALKEALDVNPWLPERRMLIPKPGTEL